MQITEQPSLYDNLEKKSVREILEDINREDQKVALAVQKAIPQIELLPASAVEHYIEVLILNLRILICYSIPPVECLLIITY